MTLPKEADPQRWPLPHGAVSALAVSADGRHAAVGVEGAVALLGLADGRVMWRATDETREPITRVQFTPDGKTFVWGDGHDVFHVTAVATGKEKHAFGGLPDGAERKLRFLDRVLTLSPDGRYLAVSSSGDRGGSGDDPLYDRVRVFEVATGEETARWQLKAGGGVCNTAVCTAFAPDNRTLAVAQRGARTVEVWERATGRVRTSFGPHPGNATCVAFSPDGNRLAAGSEDGTVLIWEVFPAARR